VSGSRCRFAYGPADATASQSLAPVNPDFLVLPSWCWLTWVVPDKIQEGHEMVVCVCVCVRAYVRACVHACVHACD